MTVHEFSAIVSEMATKNDIKAYLVAADESNVEVSHNVTQNLILLGLVHHGSMVVGLKSAEFIKSFVKPAGDV